MEWISNGWWLIAAVVGTCLWVYYDERKAQRAAESDRTPDGDDE